MTPVEDAKLALRREMRALRRALVDTAERSEKIWGHVRTLPEVADAGVVMVFDSVPGEPDSRPFLGWCRSQGKRVVVPAADPMAEPPAEAFDADVVVVPGMAFTRDGDRLGQGGGWYDRFLPRLKPGTRTIGVGFAPQLVDDLPVDGHDVRLDVVVTEDGVSRPAPEPRRR